MKRLVRLLLPLQAALAWLGDGLDLAIRLYIAEIFFRSGWLKAGNWPGTLYLFREKYQVPLLPPEAAAWLGTFGELFFPVLLALGLAARFAAISLFFVNIVAVVSFWHVLAENEAATSNHFYWGILLLIVACHGPGKISIDAWLWPRLTRLGA